MQTLFGRTIFDNKTEEGLSLIGTAPLFLGEGMRTNLSFLMIELSDPKLKST
jgi:hypothetical protein